MSIPEEKTAGGEHVRLGLVLFFVYLALYAGFVGLSAFRRSWMATEYAGINLALWYGMGLIVAAFALALVYMAVIASRSKN